MRVTGQSSHQLPLTLRTREAWHIHTVREDVAQALYYGALGAMLISNTLYGLRSVCAFTKFTYGSWLVMGLFYSF